MEDGFDLCQYDYEDCEALAKDTNALSTCKLEARQCKSNSRSARFTIVLQDSSFCIVP